MMSDLPASDHSSIRADSIDPFLAAAGASGSWDWDILADRLYVDVHFAELYGISPEATANGLPTSAFFQAIHPEDRPRIRIAVAGILAGAELFSKEFRIVTRTGVTLWMHGRGQCILSGEEKPVRFTGLLVDVTERRRAEERLRIAQTAGGIGTFEYVDGFATVSVSEEFCRVLGLHPTTVLPLQTVNGVLADGAALLVPEMRDGEVPATLDAEFLITRQDDGSARWIARRGEIIREGAGYRLIGVIYDMTSTKEQEAALRELNDTLESRVEQEVVIRQKAEEALRQVQKMEAVGQLTGGIAHDFNNLLMAIMSSLILLQKRLPADAAIDRLIDNAMQGAQRGAALTQRMLAFARRQDLVSERLEVPELVAGMIDLVERTLGPAWSLDVAFPDSLPAVLADANQLEMAILNLAVNARDAMPGGGIIRITAAHCDAKSADVGGLAQGSYIALSVIDTGEGMDEETLAKATEPFFTTKGVGKGTGLGLSMIHGFAKQLGGTFTLQSALGLGTRATLWLPIAQSAAQTATPQLVSSEPRGASGPLKVLVVDDDGLILMNTAALLEDLGHEVIEANSGEMALEYLRRHGEIDILITDQAMPTMTGTQLADLATELRGDLPIILASGYGDIPAGSQHRIVKLGKPFTQAMLEHALLEALSVHSQR
jgi:PAS domain S-box-containing protein